MKVRKTLANTIEVFGTTKQRAKLINDHKDASWFKFYNDFEESDCVVLLPHDRQLIPALVELLTAYTNLLDIEQEKVDKQKLRAKLMNDRDILIKECASIGESMFTQSPIERVNSITMIASRHEKIQELTRLIDESRK